MGDFTIPQKIFIVGLGIGVFIGMVLMGLEGKDVKLIRT
jgi:hypothetical protein